MSLVAVILAPLMAAQAPPPSSPLRLLAHGDTVTVFLTAAPPRGGGFVVYRGPAGGPLVRVTARPVTAARDGAAAAAEIGPDLVAVERAAQAVDPEDMLRRLQLDPFAAVVLSALFPRVGTALGRTFADTGLTPGARYDYRVAFTDAAGHATGHPLTGSVTVASVSPPAPTDLNATVNDHLATLRWRYPPSTVAENVFAFVVYRAGGADSTFRRVSSAPVLRSDSGPLEYRDATVSNGVTYRYRVTALNLIGREGPPSSALPVTPVDRTPPGFPADVRTQVESRGVLVVWRLSPEPDAAGYFVARADRLDGPFVPLTPTPIPVDHPSLLDTTAAGGHRYFYRVTAVDRSGNRSRPSSVAQAVVADRTPPAAPGGVTATPLAHRLVVRWHPSVTPGVMGYYVYRAAPGRIRARLMAVPLDDTMFVDSGYGTAGLRPGGRYVVGVSAVDSARNESPQTVVHVLVPDDVPPDPPADVLARQIGGRYVEVAWSAPQAPDVAAYEVQRAAGDSGFAALAHVTGPPPYMVRDTAVQHGRTYVYRVIAVDSAGNRSTPALDSLRFLRLTPPPAPRHLSARATTGGVVLVWERVADPELAGYRVYHAALPTGTFTPLETGVITGTTFTDRSPVRGWYYRARAVDTSGNLSAPSPAAQAVAP